MTGKLAGTLRARNRPRRRGQSPPRPGTGFTLVELMVVIAIIMLLVTILTPAAMAILEQARRTKCAANLKEIGSGLMMYATGHKNAFPYVPLNGGGWGVAIGEDRQTDPFTEPSPSRNPSSCLWLLVRERICPREMFICPSAGESAGRDKISPNWDFADGDRLSYALMNPYGREKYFRQTSGVVLLADASGFFDPATGLRNDKSPVALDEDSDEETIRKGNSPNHDFDGQNVYGNGGVHFAERADCGYDLDNIYTRAETPEGTDQAGSVPAPGGDASAPEQGPAGPKDSYLVP